MYESVWFIVVMFVVALVMSVGGVLLVGGVRYAVVSHSGKKKKYNCEFQSHSHTHLTLPNTYPYPPSLPHHLTPSHPYPLTPSPPHPLTPSPPHSPVEGGAPQEERKGQ